MADTVILSGIEASNALYDSLHARIGALKEKGVTPGLAAILVGENPASQIYVRNKTKKFDSLGLKSDIYRLPEDAKVSGWVEDHASSKGLRKRSRKNGESLLRYAHGRLVKERKLRHMHK